jgi:hypothetical protein
MKITSGLELIYFVATHCDSNIVSKDYGEIFAECLHDHGVCVFFDFNCQAQHLPGNPLVS